MPAANRFQGASGPAAPFSLATLLLLAALSLPAGGNDVCPAERTDERVQVSYVFDGDTVRLTDGRRVRLIGINTPELDHDGTRHDALAEAARVALKELLDTGNRTLLLQYGSDHKDHYGRLLAHAFLPDGSNVAARLLQRGLATTLVVPPNTSAMHCYQRLEDQARIDRRGLWDLPRYQVLDSDGLDPALRGFHLVRGTVRAVRHGASSTWIELEGPLVLRVGGKDRANFAAGYLDALPGRDVETRGWLKARKDGLMMNIAHPHALALLEAGAP